MRRAGKPTSCRELEFFFFRCDFFPLFLLFFPHHDFCFQTLVFFFPLVIYDFFFSNYDFLALFWIPPSFFAMQTGTFQTHTCIGGESTSLQDFTDTTYDILVQLIHLYLYLYTYAYTYTLMSIRIGSQYLHLYFLISYE